MDKTTKTILLISGIALVGGLTTYGAFRFRGIVFKKIIEDNNAKKLAELHPKYKARYANFLYDLYKAGYTPLITSGYRSIAKQNALHAQDSNASVGGHSLHNYGLALDINIMKPKFIGMQQSKADWSPIVAIAKKNGLDWGGSLFGSAYYDSVHFQPKELKAQKGTDLLAKVNAGKVDNKGYVKI